MTTTEASFEVDTVAPAYVVESPAANGYVASATPQFKIRYSDELSGVDTARAIVLIDGVDKTVRFTFADGTGTGTLQPAEALAEGLHSIDVTIYDRAGQDRHRTAEVHRRHHCTTAAVEAPLTGGYVGKARTIAVTYRDTNGSGIDPASVKITIDTEDRTADFTVGPARATAAIATQLANGSHTLVVTVLDWAGNPASATSTFTIDSVDPVVKIKPPPPTHG